MGSGVSFIISLALTSTLRTKEASCAAIVLTGMSCRGVLALLPA